MQLKAIAKERGIRSYYNLRKVEMIHTLEATRLLEQTNNILDESIPNDQLQFYNQHIGDHQISRRKLRKMQRNSLLRVCKRLKILVHGCCITYHQNEKWLTKCLSVLKTKLKRVRKEGCFVSTNTVQICFQKLCDSVPNKRIKWIRRRIISA